MQEAGLHSSKGALRNFRQLKEGPEALLQGAVEARLDDVLPSWDGPTWTGGTVPLGGGIPDIVRIAYNPEVIALDGIDVVSLAILSYLRIARKASGVTIADRLGKTPKSIERHLLGLEQAHIIGTSGKSYVLSSNWRSVLPDVLSVEVKVTDWRKAVSQAARNRIFSHRSYIAIPDKIARRVRAETLFGELGVGILGIGPDNELHVVKRARLTKPRAWTYYYTLAAIAASEVKKGGLNVHS